MPYLIKDVELNILICEISSRLLGGRGVIHYLKNIYSLDI